MKSNHSAAAGIDAFPVVPSISVSKEISNARNEILYQAPPAAMQQSTLLATEHSIPAVTLTETPVRCGSARFVSPAASTKSLPFKYDSEPDLEKSESSPTLSRSQQNDVGGNLPKKYSSNIVSKAGESEAQGLAKQKFAISQRLPTIREDVPRTVAKPIGNESKFDKPEWRRPRGPSLVHHWHEAVSVSKHEGELERRLESAPKSEPEQKLELKANLITGADPEPKRPSISDAKLQEKPTINAADIQRPPRQVPTGSFQTLKPPQNKYGKQQHVQRPTLASSYPSAERLQTLPNGYAPMMPFQHQAAFPHSQNVSPRMPVNIQVPIQDLNQRPLRPIMTTDYSPRMAQYNPHSEILQPGDRGTQDQRKMPFGMASREMYGGPPMTHFPGTSFPHELRSPPIFGSAPYMGFPNDARVIEFQNGQRFRTPLDERRGSAGQRETFYRSDNARRGRRDSGSDRAEFPHYPRYAGHTGYSRGASSPRKFFRSNQSISDQADPIFSTFYDNQPPVSITHIPLSSISPSQISEKPGGIPMSVRGLEVPEQNALSSQVHMSYPLLSSDTSHQYRQDMSIPPGSAATGSAYTCTMPSEKEMMLPCSPHDNRHASDEFCDDKLYIGGPNLTFGDIYDILQQCERQFEVTGPFTPTRPKNNGSDNYRLVFAQ